MALIPSNMALGHILLEDPVIRINYIMKLKSLLLSILILFLATACMSRAEIDATKTAVVLATAEESARLTEVNKLTHTNTAIPTDTPTVTPSNTPTKTSTPSKTPTETPTPTVTPTETPNYGGLIWPRAIYSESNITWRQGYCAHPGRDLGCEIEYRRDSQGCYVGMTCYDVCGWYYSINTIPAGVGPEYGSVPCW